MVGPFDIFLGMLPYLLLLLLLGGLSWYLRRTRGAVLWVLLIWIVGIVLFEFGPVWADRWLNADEYIEKFGQVVDAESGKGIPGVYVIAEGSLTTHAIHTATRPEYRVIVLSDAEGKYRIPSTRQYAVSPDSYWLTFFIGRSRHQWAITPVMPGYIGAQDKKYVIPATGSASLRVFHENVTPPHRWAGSAIEVQPMSLLKYDLEPAQAIVYYRLATTQVREGGEVLRRLNHELLDYMLKKICSTDAGPKVRADIASNIGDFLDWSPPMSARSESAQDRYKRELRASEPSGFEPYNGPAVFLSGSDHPYFQTSNVCKILSPGVAP